MAFARACAVAEVPADEALAVVIGDQQVAVARDGEELFAVEDLCSHAHVVLSEGEVVARDGLATIGCWLHGSCFDLRTGQPTALPATVPVATFPVDVRDGDVYVDTQSSLNGVVPQ